MPRSASQRGRTRRRAITAKLIVLAVSCSLCFVVLEVFCRLLGFAPPTPPIPPDRTKLHSADFIREAQEKAWIHWPHSHTVTETTEHPSGKVVFKRNGSSFREDEETPIEKPDDTFRIIVTGDSHTDGAVWNHESYPNLLEQRLSDNSEAKFDVINAGFATFSPYQELWAYRKVLQRFDPDCLVVAFYAGNDLWDLTATDRVHLERRDDTFIHVEPAVETPAPPEQVGAFRRFKDAVGSRLAVYQALANIRSLRKIFGELPEVDEAKQLAESAAEISTGGYWQSLGQAQYFRDRPEAWGEYASMMRFVLKQFWDETKSHDVSLHVLVIPTLRQIHSHTDQEDYQEAAAHLKLTEHDLQVDDRAADLVVQLANELGIPVTDLREPLREAFSGDQSQELYWRFDHHLSLAGHRVLAEQLQPILLQEFESRKLLDRQ